ncbi:hypothetical protein CR513_45193, partial [Mucuna pruriens]
MEEIKVNGKGLLLSPKEETSIRTKEDEKSFDETEECFILDFDPYESLHFSKLSLDNHLHDASDVSIIAEKGPLACRDYPHPRHHLCLKFPFTTTPHNSYCEMCYCYVCDSAAPCKYWTPLHSHTVMQIRRNQEINMKSSTAEVEKKRKRKIIDMDSPIRAIACLNRIDDMRRFEETEDCFILGFDPSAAVPLSSDYSAPRCDADDVSVVAEKGQVACRDYPHSRHLCLQFPFKNTRHESHCAMRSATVMFVIRLPHVRTGRAGIAMQRVMISGRIKGIRRNSQKRVALFNSQP